MVFVMIKNPSPVHAQKRSKNFTMLAILAAWILLLFTATMVRIAMGH